MFLERVDALIKKHGITRNKLSKDIGINTNSFVDWKKNDSIPKGEVIAKIADYFNVSTDYLLGRTDVITQQGDTSGLSEQQRECLYLFDNGTPEMRAMFLAMMRSAEAGNTSQGDGGANR